MGTGSKNPCPLIYFVLLYLQYDDTVEKKKKKKEEEDRCLTFLQTNESKEEVIQIEG